MKKNIAILLILIIFPANNVFAKTIIIGQSLPLTGKMSKKADQFLKGSLLWIKYINDKGGINGQKLELKTLDDKNQPEIAVRNTEKLIQKKASILFGYMGHKASMKSAELANRAGIPFFAPSTGSTELHEYPKPNIFMLTPGYYYETQNMIKALLSNGDKKIAIFYSSDNWGKSAFKGAEWCFKDNNLQIFAIAEAKTNNKEKINKAALSIYESEPDAVLVAADTDIAVLFIKQLKKLKSKTKIIAFSDVNGETLSARLMNQGVGVVISQVVPFPYYQKMPIVKLFNRLKQKYSPGKQLTFNALEGFISARAMTEIISRCSKPVDKSDFISTAKKIGSVNLGGFIFNFSGKNQTGSQNTYFTQIAPGGFLSPIMSLKEIYKNPVF